MTRSHATGELLDGLEAMVAMDTTEVRQALPVQAFVKTSSNPWYSSSVKRRALVVLTFAGACECGAGREPLWRCNESV